jgi:hypothetical protein
VGNGIHVYSGVDDIEYLLVVFEWWFLVGVVGGLLDQLAELLGEVHLQISQIM